MSSSKIIKFSKTSEIISSEESIQSLIINKSRSSTLTPPNTTHVGHVYNLRSGKKYDCSDSTTISTVSKTTSQDILQSEKSTLTIKKSTHESDINDSTQIKTVNQLDWWDIKPKTDYTYSHTTTYQSSGLNNSPPPNLSRRLLRRKVNVSGGASSIMDIRRENYDLRNKKLLTNLFSQYGQQSYSEDQSMSSVTYESDLDENSKDNTTEKNFDFVSLRSSSIFNRFINTFFMVATFFSRIITVFYHTNNSSDITFQPTMISKFQSYYSTITTFFSRISTYLFHTDNVQCARTAQVMMETVNIGGVNKRRVVINKNSKTFFLFFGFLKQSYLDKYFTTVFWKSIKKFIFWILAIILLLILIWFLWCSFINLKSTTINNETNINHYKFVNTVDGNSANFDYNKLAIGIESLKTEIENIQLNSDSISLLTKKQELLERQFSEINATIISIIIDATSSLDFKTNESFKILKQNIILEIDEKLKQLLKMHNNEVPNTFIVEYQENLINIKENFSLLKETNYKAIKNVNDSINNLQQVFLDHTNFVSLEMKIINDKLVKLKETSDKIIPLFDIVNSLKSDISLFNIDDIKLKILNLELSINSTNNYIKSLHSAIKNQDYRISSLENNKHNMDLFIRQTVVSEIKKNFELLKNSESNDIFMKCNLNTDINKLPFLTKSSVSLMVKEAIDLYSADRLGLVDYALESSGGAILSTRCTKTHTRRYGMYTVFGIPFWYVTSNPRWIIQPENLPGNCWAMEGSHGTIIIQLSDKITPNAFTLEHISAKISPEGSITSAPRNFSVYALDSPKDKIGVNLGNFTYDKNGEPLQTFAAMTIVDAVRIVELKIESNHGNPEYTCIYRFRVHGKRVD